MSDSQLHCHLGEYAAVIDEALDDLKAQKVVERIWKYDHTVWKEDPAEITNRLGWLDIAKRLQSEVPNLQSFSRSVREAGYTHALLLGMGGSSLAPEMLFKTFGPQPDGLNLDVLDSTDPDTVLAKANNHDPEKTLYIVATKSGGTVETRSFFTYFYNFVQDRLSGSHAGSHFIAITDAGSDLESMAAEYGFRETFLNDSNIGGRYSALSYFGLVPAALIGLDLDRLLASAVSMQKACQKKDNPAVRLGVILGKMALSGRDKTTLFFSEPLASFGDWIEQLIAESTGKENRVGILPVVGETLIQSDSYGSDRLFIGLGFEQDTTLKQNLQQLHQAGHPVVHIILSDVYALGGQFLMWELATAISCEQLRVNPFDQPHVQYAKIIAKEKIEDYKETHKIPFGQPLKPNVEALNDFIYQARPGDYIALQAFVNPTPETDETLARLRIQLQKMTKLAVTVGYGPRFLHSTGQLHKGDSGKGLFIQFITDIPQKDPAIPVEAGASDSVITFGILRTAQALGDYEALLNANRRAIRFDLGVDPVQGIVQLLHSTD